MIREGDTLKVLAESGVAESSGIKELPLEDPAIRRILDTKENILCREGDTGSLSDTPSAGHPAGTLLMSPLLVGGEVNGIIRLTSGNGSSFGAADSELVKTLAEDIAFILERSTIYSNLKDLSILDGLTGQFNRRKFNEDLVTETERSMRYKSPLSLLFLDIDWFKKYNDHHGHLMGDKLLQQFVASLKKNVRRVDRIYRYGGEEFAVLLPETEKEGARITAEKLQALIESEPYEGEEESQPNGKLTVSIGVSNCPNDAIDSKELINSADIALYGAKETGRNRVCVFKKHRAI